MENESSILSTIKTMLGPGSHISCYDTELVVYINMVFAILHDLGIGPDECFSIVDNDSLWEDFQCDTKILNFVKDFIYLKVRIMFDPPESSVLMQALEKQASEIEWRLTAQ